MASTFAPLRLTDAEAADLAASEAVDAAAEAYFRATGSARSALRAPLRAAITTARFARGVAVAETWAGLWRAAARDLRRHGVAAAGIHA